MDDPHGTLAWFVKMRGLTPVLARRASRCLGDRQNKGGKTTEAGAAATLLLSPKPAWEEWDVKG